MLLTWPQQKYHGNFHNTHYSSKNCGPAHIFWPFIFCEVATGICVEIVLLMRPGAMKTDKFFQTICVLERENKLWSSVGNSCSMWTTSHSLCPLKTSLCIVCTQGHACACHSWGKHSLLQTDTCHIDTNSSQEVLPTGENSSMPINLVADVIVELRVFSDFCLSRLWNSLGELILV